MNVNEHSWAYIHGQSLEMFSWTNHVAWIIKTVHQELQWRVHWAAVHLQVCAGDLPAKLVAIKQWKLNGTFVLSN